MNHYKAREINIDGHPSGRWHYTCHNDNQGRTWPVGYCAELSSPCYAHGHLSAEEACACKKRYDLDKHLILTMRNPLKLTQICRCQVPGCDDWGPNLMEIQGGMKMWFVCDKHLNRETAEQLHVVGESLGSY